MSVSALNVNRPSTQSYLLIILLSVWSAKYPNPADVLTVLPLTMVIVPPLNNPIGLPWKISVEASVCVPSANVTDNFLVMSFSPSTSSKKFQ